MVTPTEVQWVRSSGIPPRVLVFGGLLIVVAFAVVGVVAGSVGGAGMVRALEFAPSGSIGAAAIGVVWGFGIAVPILLLLVIVSAGEVRIGLTSEGIELVSRLRRRRLRWDQLWPTDPRPSSGWLLVSYRLEGRPGLRYFWATEAQAHALAMHPKAPFNLFPPPWRDRLGIAPPAPPS